MSNNFLVCIVKLSPNSKTVLGVFKEIQKLNLIRKTPKTVLLVTKYRSEAVLYSKRSAGYPLSPHIKTIAVAFLPAE